MFVALSRFVVRDDIDGRDMPGEIREAFRERPHLVDQAEGYVRMDVISPVEEPAEFWLITYWTDQESYQRWHRSHMYHESHDGIPKGLKLVRGENRITFFDHITS